MDKCSEYSALWYVCMPNISRGNQSCYQATSLSMARATKISPPAELQTGRAVVAWSKTGDEGEEEAIQLEISTLVFRFDRKGVSAG